MNNLNPSRWAAIAALAATAGIHLALVPQHLQEAPYAGGLFIALAIAALMTGVLLARSDRPLGWLGAGTLALVAAFGYVISRSVGLPAMGDDVGDWLNPLGVAAVACETMVAGLAVRSELHRYTL